MNEQFIIETHDVVPKWAFTSQKSLEGHYSRLLVIKFFINYHKIINYHLIISYLLFIIILIIVSKLGLYLWDHPSPYPLEWVNEDAEIKVTK